MQVEAITHWFILVKQARERGIQTAGEFILGLALAGIQPTPEGMAEIMRAYATPYVTHSAN